MIDFDRFLREHVEITNDTGGRGYDSGVRTFSCPFCGDEKNRGWLGIEKMGAGCFNIGCVAEPTLEGGAVEWARRILRLGSRGEAYRLLIERYGTESTFVTPAKDLSIDDWCRLPASAHSFTCSSPHPLAPLQREFENFIGVQWGLSIEDAQRWDLRWCLSGRYAWRVIIPIVMGGRIVAFQARTIRDAEPKYITSRHGAPDDPLAECGRPAARLLFNADALRKGLPAVIVEGVGDVMGWAKDARHDPAVGLLGVALTPAKESILLDAEPGFLTVALDAEVEAQARARAHADRLRTIGLRAAPGEWVGGKDAGSGARLGLITHRDIGVRLGDQIRARRRLPTK